MITLILLLASGYLIAQVPAKFEAGVAFNSICCGPPDDAFLQKFYRASKKCYNTIAAYKAGGCGREGEFRILFKLSGMKTTDRKKFLKELKELVLRQDKANKAKNSSSGSVEMLQFIKRSDLSYCGSGISKWPK